MLLSRGLRRCFKPCYKWITFNTNFKENVAQNKTRVLNLVINGLPSIRKNEKAFNECLASINKF